MYKSRKTLPHDTEKQSRISHRRCSVRKGVIRNFAKFTGKHLCQSLFFNKVAGHVIKKEILAQAFSCEFCKISKNTFFAEHLWATISKNPIHGILNLIEARRNLNLSKNGFHFRLKCFGKNYKHSIAKKLFRTIFKTSLS